MVFVTDGSQLRDWLAGRTADQLAAILEYRPQTLWGAPLHGLDDLAARLVQPASVGAAVAELPLPGLELLHALAALGPTPTVTMAAALLDAGDRTPEAQRDAVLAALTLLSDRALAWAVDTDGIGAERIGAEAIGAEAIGAERIGADRIGAEAIVINPGAVLVIDRPMDLGRTLASHLEHSPVDQLRGLLRNLGLPDASRRDDVSRLLLGLLTDRDRVRDLLATAPAAAIRRLKALSTMDPSPRSFLPKDQQDREGENWARRRGLLFGGDYFAPEVPIEIILAVRAGELVVSFDPDPPELTTTPLTAAAITAGAAGAAAEFTETVAAVLDWIGRSPPPALKAGGVGAREITRIARGVGSDDTRVRFALELVRDLGLLGAVGDRVGSNAPAAAWRAAEPSTRFADLAVTWWGLPVMPTISRDLDGKAIPAMGRRAADAEAMTLRWAVIDAIGALPGGDFADISGVPGPADELAAAHQNQPE